MISNGESFSGGNSCSTGKATEREAPLWAWLLSPGPR